MSTPDVEELLSRSRTAESGDYATAAATAALVEAQVTANLIAYYQTQAQLYMWSVDQGTWPPMHQAKFLERLVKMEEMIERRLGLDQLPEWK